ncbi:hypothetical protein F5884DRAFT_675774 [Xylogone sp. PMI_703]|nr:hypothetical protein F5884DRAFT_675774 [Xylogone sp. PMI_703]
MRQVDSTWLNFRAGLEDVFLQECHRAYTIFHELKNAERQTPQMIMLLGQQVKNQVMRKLQFGAKFNDGSADETHLHLDLYSSRNEAPMLFADCALHNSSDIKKVLAARCSGDIVQHPLSWHKRGLQASDPWFISQRLYSRLLLPFCTAICLFADDIGGLQGAAEILAFWLMSLKDGSSDLPESARPRMLILHTFSEGIFNESQTTRNLLYEVDRLLSQVLSGVEVLALPSLASGPRAWKSLKGIILGTSNELHRRRQEARFAFTTPHFKAFFGMACSHFCSELTAPFSFVQASRIPDPLPLHIPSQVEGFLKRVQPSQVLNFAVHVIASSFAFECYPAGMHGMYAIVHWRIELIVGYANSTHYLPLTRRIETSFIEYATKMITSSDSGQSVHRQNLGQFKIFWKQIFSNSECLACILRKPEHTMSCGHSLCTTCIRSHGHTTTSEPWRFVVKTCPLCNETNNITFDVKPSTAGVRVFVAEGGGVKGVVTFPFLSRLQSEVGLPIEMHEHFDAAFGTSSGALIVLGLFRNKWSVQECEKRFVSLAQLAFQKRIAIPLATPRWLRQCIELVLSIVTDSRYSSAGITTAVKLAYGADSSLFQSTCGSTKVGITATTIEDATTCIFTNYNRPNLGENDCGYRLIPPEDDSKEMRVWELARASSAAPPYFKPHCGYQDGGLGGHNNPINIALWEQDSIWDRHNKQPDIVLSLGTGFNGSDDEDAIEDSDRHKTDFVACFLQMFRESSLARLFRSYMRSFEGELRWRELQNSLPPKAKERYHRLNIEFCGVEPSLDDIQAIPSLRDQAKAQAISNDNVKKCANNLIASLFYIELDGLPVFDQTTFLCKGKICCRLGSSHAGLHVLVERLWSCKARFYLDFHQSIPCVDQESYNGIKNGLPFARPVVFKVLSLDESIDIKIDGIIKRPRSISNCPYSIRKLIKDQGLDCIFGSRKHQRAVENPPYTSKRVKYV